MRQSWDLRSDKGERWDKGGMKIRGRGEDEMNYKAAGRVRDRDKDRGRKRQD